jgi:hypothetical protein
MEVSGQLHAPAALPPGKEPMVPIGGWVGTRAGLDAVVKRKSPSFCQGSTLNIFNPSTWTLSSTTYAKNLPSAYSSYPKEKDFRVFLPPEAAHQDCAR